MSNSNNNCTLTQLRDWVESSPLAHKCLVLYMTNDLNLIIHGFDSVRQAALTWDEDLHRPLLVAVCMLYLIHDPRDPYKHMRGLLYRVLGLIDTKSPLIVHGHVEYLINELQKANVDQENNIFRLAMGLVRISVRGLPLGVCLLWSICGQILNLNISMHRYREFKELAQALGPVTRFNIACMPVDQLDILDLLLETINRLLDLIMLNNNTDLMQFGYPQHFFQMRRVDIESMQSWATDIIYQVNMEYHWFGQIVNQANEMLFMLNRIKNEIPELVEVKEVPMEWKPAVDNYSDVDD